MGALLNGWHKKSQCAITRPILCSKASRFKDGDLWSCLTQPCNCSSKHEEQTSELFALGTNSEVPYNCELAHFSMWNSEISSKLIASNILLLWTGSCVTCSETRMCKCENIRMWIVKRWNCQEFHGLEICSYKNQKISQTLCEVFASVSLRKCFWKPRDNLLRNFEQFRDRMSYSTLVRQPRKNSGLGSGGVWASFSTTIRYYINPRQSGFEFLSISHWCTMIHGFGFGT